MCGRPIAGLERRNRAPVGAHGDDDLGDRGFGDGGLTDADTDSDVGPVPEMCGPLPDIDGLPAPPSAPTEEAVEAFVRDFERAYSLATNDEYGAAKALRIHSVERVGERYVVSLSFDAVPVTPTADVDGATPTPRPPVAYAHRAVYRRTEDRMLRVSRSHIDDSRLSRTCWTLDGG